MNDKCCNNCEHNLNWDMCPFVWYGMDAEKPYRKTPYSWNDTTDSCSRHISLPDKPGKIEPLHGVIQSDNLVPVIGEIVKKINELIAELNRRGE